MKLSTIILSVLLLKIQTILSREVVFVNFFGGYSNDECNGTPSSSGWSFALYDNQGCFALPNTEFETAWSMNATESGQVSLSLWGGQCYMPQGPGNQIFEQNKCYEIPNFYLVNNNVPSYAIVTITNEPALPKNSVIIKENADWECEYPDYINSYPIGFTQLINGQNVTYSCNSNNDATTNTCTDNNSSCSSSDIENSCTLDNKETIYCI